MKNENRLRLIVAVGSIILMAHAVGLLIGTSRWIMFVGAMFLYGLMIYQKK